MSFLEIFGAGGVCDAAGEAVDVGAVADVDPAGAIEAPCDDKPHPASNATVPTVSSEVMRADREPGRVTRLAIDGLT